MNDFSLKLDRIFPHCRSCQVSYGYAVYFITCFITMTGLNVATARFLVSAGYGDSDLAIVGYTTTREVVGLSPDIVDFWFMKEVEAHGADMVAAYMREASKR